MFGHLLHYTAGAVDELLIEDFERLLGWIDQQLAQQSGGGE
ncbi:hypothetical protein [Streptomyces sp. NPDC001774]